jgi:hypothetical protein
MDDTQHIAKLARMVQENFFAHQLFLPERLASCTVLKAKELIVINSHIAEHTYNMVLRARLDDATAVPAITSTLAYFKREGVPFSWWIAPDDAPENLPQLLALNGIAHKSTQYVLVQDLHDAPGQQIEVHVERLQTPVHLQDALQVLYQAYGDAAYVQQWYKQLLDYAWAEDDYERWYIAYVDESPVAVAPLTIFANMAGIYQVALARVPRREIIKEAVITELLGYAFTLGIEHACVVCPEQEVEYYRELGFDDLLTFEQFSL